MENDATPFQSDEQVGGERVTALAYDASPWIDEEMDQLAAESADALGWEGTDAYQDPPL